MKTYKETRQAERNFIYHKGYAEGKRDAMKWISVKERLPEYGRNVLAFVKNKNPEGRYNKDGIYVAQLEDKIPQPDPQGKRNFWGLPGYDNEWTVWSWSYFSEPEVTHWMPLPDPPEVEE